MLNGELNLKLFNQLYWVVTIGFVAVLHAIFPLPQLVSGTFPENSRYLTLKYVQPIFLCSRRGRICLLRDIEGNFNFEDKAFQFQLFRLIVPTLVMIMVWHFYAKVRSFLLSTSNLKQKSQLNNLTF